MVSAFLAFVVHAIPAAAPATAPDTLVVCPPEFREALAPWVAHRTAQGHRISFIANSPTADAIQKAIRKAAGKTKPRFVVLIGDAEPNAGDAQTRDRCIPTFKVKAKVNVLFGSEKEIATDNPFADLDGDQLPDLAIGRITADSPSELTRIVKKIIAYERSNGGAWNRRLSFTAGIGGFGALTDAMIEMGAKRIITAGVPTRYTSSMTYGSWQSPYCPDPRQFRQTTLRRLNEGCLFWVYIGHGHRRGLDRVRVPGGLYPILSTADVGKMRSRAGLPIALFLACYTCAFDGRQDCLAEEMLRTEGAPVAIIGGTRVTMPYAMAVLSSEMLDECLKRRRETLGEVLLHGKRRMIRQRRQDATGKLLDTVAGLIGPAEADPAQQRKEHLHLMSLIGDPMLRIRYPGQVKVNVADTVTAGERLEVGGSCDATGTATVELAVRRDQLTFRPMTRRAYAKTDGALAAYQDVYRKANDPRLASVRTAVEDGRFRAQLTVPAHVRGRVHVRVLVSGGKRAAIGAANVYVRGASRPAPK